MIAETARQRQDLAEIAVPAQLAADLALLTGHRTDLVADRVRMLNRLRDTLTGIFPALERAFDYSSQRGPVEAGGRSGGARWVSRFRSCRSGRARGAEQGVV